MRLPHYSPQSATHQLPPGSCADSQLSAWKTSFLMTAVLLAFQVTVQADERPSEQLLTQAARNELLDVDAIDCHGMDVAINEAS